MESSELADRLDFWTGRRGVTADPPRRPRRRPRNKPPSSRARPLAAAVLVAALAAGWLIFSRHHDAQPASNRSVSATVPSSRPAPSTTVGAAGTMQLRELIGGGTGCVDVRGGMPEVTCVVGAVRVDARLVGAAGALRSYTAAAGANPAAHQGPPACASGHDDERAWARPVAPTRPAGRYRCRLEAGHAAIWWTDDHGVVAHAVAADRDLARLFAWWRSHLLG
jgi:hypothetical protein